MWTSPLYRWRPDVAPPRPELDRPASAAPDERIEVAAADGYPVRSTLKPADLAARHGATRARLLAIGLTDDPFCTEAAGQRLLGYYSAADRTHLRIAPSEIAVPEIGHFAFFHARFAQTLWPLAAAWLLSGRLPEEAPGRIVSPAG